MNDNKGYEEKVKHWMKKKTNGNLNKKVELKKKNYYKRV